MKKDSCRMAVIGLGGRGHSMMEVLMNVPGVHVVAVCDVIEERLDAGLKTAKARCAEGYDVHAYTDYHEMLEIEELDGVYVATTWITHIPISIDCMKAGVNVGVEVGGAASIEECWSLIRASQETGKFCMLMENCCYDRKEMAVYNMVKQGIFGEIVHCEGGYRHDLRDEIVLGRENKHGRLVNFMHRNGELYPTHEIGPIAKLLKINKGNRFVSLVSVASKQRGLNEWIKNVKGEDYDLYGYDFKCGDVVTTILKCANGETVTINHDCSLPRPYSREYTVQGTKAVFKEAPDDGNGSIYIDGVSPQHKWEDFNEKYADKYLHPLWKKYDAEKIKAGHGGMDYLILLAFADSIMNETKPPIDTIDTATWMVITALSEQSVALGGTAVAFPDFTNGMWINRDNDFDRNDICLDDICEECF